MKEQSGHQALAFLNKEGFGNKEPGYQNKEDPECQNTSDLIDQPQDNHGFSSLENAPEEYLDKVYIIS